MSVSAEQIKQAFTLAKSNDELSNYKVTCACGKCSLNDMQLTDEDFEELARIINGESQTEEV